MYQRLTLNIEKDVIKKAKLIARNKKTSLSSMVQDFLIEITQENKTSVVQYIIDNAPLKKTKPGTEKEIIRAYLKKKHSL